MMTDLSIVQSELIMDFEYFPTGSKLDLNQNAEEIFIAV